MGVFEDVQLGWNGADFTVPSNRVMGLIARIEDVATLAELYDMLGRPRGLKLSKIAAAYAAALRYAGSAVTDEEVYAGMFGNDRGPAIVTDALIGLLGMMVPASAVKDAAPGKAGPAAARSSQKRSGSRAPRRRPAAGA